MRGDLPISNRVIFKRQVERTNDMLARKIYKIKFSNFSAFKIQEQSQHVNRTRSVDMKVLPLQPKIKVAKTSLNNTKIRQENKFLYNRLINQKSILSSKTLAVQRQRNVQVLNRIRKYSIKDGRTLKTQMSSEQQRQKSQHLRERLTNGHSVNVSLSHLNSSMIDLKRQSITEKIDEQDKRHHVIILWNRMIQINKNLYEIKIIRFKNYYQIQIRSHSFVNLYYLNLPEQLGTDLFTENDYDYEYICQHYIKISYKKITLMFDLKKDKEKFQLKFKEKRSQERMKRLDEEVNKQRINGRLQNNMRVKQQISMIKYRDESCIVEDTEQEGLDDDKLLEAINVNNIFLDNYKSK